MRWNKFHCYRLYLLRWNKFHCYDLYLLRWNKFHCYNLYLLRWNKFHCYKIGRSSGTSWIAFCKCRRHDRYCCARF